MNYFCLIFFSLLMLTMQLKIWARKMQIIQRVVEGRDALPGEYPFVVSLESLKPDPIGSYRLCTGSLVTGQWVLTAAHCLIDDTEVVRYGNMTSPRNATISLRKVLKKKPHPAFRSKEMVLLINDIGLILVERIDMNVYAKISGIDYKTLTGLPVKYAGLGLLLAGEEMKEILALLLHNITPLQIGEGVVCEDHISHLDEQLINVVPKCANLTAHPTFGDSGGPLFYRDTIIGVCSGGFPYDPKNRAHSVIKYTPVSPYLHWIQNVIREEHTQE